MKAQASLEMVVGLIILLVVAGVVISLVIHYINPQRMPNPSEQLSVRAFLENCETYCKDVQSIQYCKYYYPGDDWNKNGVKNELIKLGIYEWPTCEKRVYCFLAYPCEDRFGTGLASIERCKKILCQTYLEKYEGDTVKANKALRDAVDVSVCDFSGVPADDNWYEKIFAPGCK